MLFLDPFGFLGELPPFNPDYQAPANRMNRASEARTTLLAPRMPRMEIRTVQILPTRANAGETRPIRLIRVPFPPMGK
jgi:hypothetical protein